ncbi:hypothetical protein [Conexibacter woesei]|uniref:hypothetical protein n=1 Tax=Conexibacter woesei TaxID=191495 RepID=UPI00047AA3F6|nr:hypothetical protein [Conexibacter woesei]
MVDQAVGGSGVEGLTPTGRVPVEHRFFGLDRRSLLPGLVVIGLFVLWTVVVPAVDNLLSYSQETRAGDVFVLDKGLTMDAQAGWGVDSGLLTTDKTQSGTPGETVVLAKGGSSFVVEPGPFRGSAERLLSQIKKVDTALEGDKAYHVAGTVQSFHTTDGHRGVAQAYTTVQGAGVVAALVYGNTGVKITLTGPTATIQDQADEVEKMIDSIHYDPRAAR